MEAAKLIVTCLSNSWGGLEMAAFEFVEELTLQGFGVLAICHRDSPFERAAKAQGLTVRTVDPAAPFLRRLRVLRKMIRDYSPDLIVMNRLPTLKLMVPALWGFPKIRLAAISHMLVNYRKKNLYHRALYRRLDKLVVLTEHQLRNHLEHLPVDPRRTAIIPDWIHFSTAHETPARDLRREFPDAVRSLPICLTASRLDPQKGIDLAIRALAHAKAQGRPFLLAILGENTRGESDVESELRRLTNKLSLGNYVRFLGHHEKIVPFFAAADVLLVPSHEETFGRVIIEAFAAGLPVIASGCGGPLCLIEHGVTGLLFETKNAISLETKIAELISQVGLREKISANSLREARRFEKPAIFRRLLQEFDLAAPLVKLTPKRSAATLQSRWVGSDVPNSGVASTTMFEQEGAT